MTLEHLDEEKLQRYFDGETASGESTIVQRHLDECASCMNRFEKLEKLRSLFSEMVNDVSEGPAFDAMYASIRTGIEKQKSAGFGERLRLVVSDAVTYRRRAVVSTAAVVFAAAAAIVIMWGSLGRHDEDGIQVGGLRGSEVEEVQFGMDGAGTVFQIENGDGTSAAVIWINDDE